MTTTTKTLVLGFLVMMTVGCGQHSNPFAPTGDSASSTPSLGVTVAFGDSITAGEVAPPLSQIIVEDSYPTRLQTMLRTTDSKATVINAGISGEDTASGASRLSEVLSTYHPVRVLVMEGSNDVNGDVDDDTIAAHLGEMVDTAQGMGVTVFLGTIPPQVSGGYRADDPSGVAGLNSRIRQLASAKHVTLVDIYSVIDANVAVNVGPDGLHPSPQGYIAIAQAFKTAIEN